MELHKALRNIIQTDGPDILKEVRLINILDDFNAYQDIPASKYILRAIIADGYSSKLMAIGKWDNAAEALTTKFATVTGFVPESAIRIFQSMAYGLGWINEMPEVRVGQPLPSQQQPPSKPLSSGNPMAASLMLTSSKIVRRSQDFRIDYSERAAEYLDSITELKNINDINIRVFSKLTIYDNPTSYIGWSIEVNGNISLKSGGIAEPFEIVLYNYSGRILATETVSIYNPIKEFGVIQTERVEEDAFKCVGNIGKIIVYRKK